MPEGFYNGWPDDNIAGHKRTSEAFRNFISTYVSCWNRADFESYAFWRIYTNPTTGIAIKSTTKKLKNALNNVDIKLYKTEYIKSLEDKTDDKEPPTYLNIVKRASSMDISHRVKEVYKYEPYRYENEIRAVYIEYSNKKGLAFPVDVNELINEIYISPFASVSFNMLVKSVLEKIDKEIAKKPIINSTIKI